MIDDNMNSLEKTGTVLKDPIKKNKIYNNNEEYDNVK